MHCDDDLVRAESERRLLWLDFLAKFWEVQEIALALLIHEFYAERLFCEDDVQHIISECADSAC